MKASDVIAKPLVTISEQEVKIQEQRTEISGIKRDRKDDLQKHEQEVAALQTKLDMHSTSRLNKKAKLALLNEALMGMYEKNTRTLLWLYNKFMANNEDSKKCIMM